MSAPCRTRSCDHLVRVVAGPVSRADHGHGRRSLDGQGQFHAVVHKRSNGGLPQRHHRIFALARAARPPRNAFAHRTRYVQIFGRSRDLKSGTTAQGHVLRLLKAPGWPGRLPRGSPPPSVCFKWERPFTNTTNTSVNGAPVSMPRCVFSNTWCGSGSGSLQRARPHGSGSQKKFPLPSGRGLQQKVHLRVCRSGS